MDVVDSYDPPSLLVTPTERYHAAVAVQQMANRILAKCSDFVCRESKATVCFEVESTLMRLDCYGGFGWYAGLAFAKEVKPEDAGYYDRTYFVKPPAGTSR